MVTASEAACNPPEAVADALLTNCPVLEAFAWTLNARDSPGPSVPASNATALLPSSVFMPSGSGSVTRTFCAMPEPVLVTTILIGIGSHRMTSAGAVFTIRSAG